MESFVSWYWTNHETQETFHESCVSVDHVWTWDAVHGAQTYRDTSELAIKTPTSIAYMTLVSLIHHLDSRKGLHTYGWQTWDMGSCWPRDRLTSGAMRDQRLTGISYSLTHLSTTIFSLPGHDSINRLLRRIASRVWSTKRDRRTHGATPDNHAQGSGLLVCCHAQQRHRPTQLPENRIKTSLTHIHANLSDLPCDHSMCLSSSMSSETEPRTSVTSFPFCTSSSSRIMRQKCVVLFTTTPSPLILHLYIQIWLFYL